MSNYQFKPQFLVALALILAAVALLAFGETFAVAGTPAASNVAQSAQGTTGTVVVTGTAALTETTGVTSPDDHLLHHPEEADDDSPAVVTTATVSVPVMMSMMGEMMSMMGNMQSMMAPGMMGAGTLETMPMSGTVPMTGMGPDGQSVNDCAMIGPMMSMMGSMMSMMGAMQTIEGMMAGHGMTDSVDIMGRGMMTGTLSMPGTMMAGPGMMGAGMMNSAEGEFMLDHMMQMMGQMQSMTVACQQSEQASQPFDLGFIDSMILHHEGAVAMARQALEEAEHEEIRQMAQAVIDAQEAEIGQMVEWRSAWYADAAPSLGMGMDMGMMEIGDGDQPFDLRFIDAMISHHAGAIAMAQEALASAGNEEIRLLAQAIIDAQQAEIAQMQAWRAEWYPDAD